MKMSGPLPVSAPRREGPEQHVAEPGAEGFGLAFLLAVLAPAPPPMPVAGAPLADGDGGEVHDPSWPGNRVPSPTAVDPGPPLPVPASAPRVERTGVPWSHTIPFPSVPVVGGSARTARDGDATIQPIGDPALEGSSTPADGLAAPARGGDSVAVVQAGPALVTRMGSRPSAPRPPAAPDFVAAVEGAAVAGRERPETGSSPTGPPDTAAPPASAPDGGGLAASATPPYAGPVATTVDSRPSPGAVRTGVHGTAVPDPSGAGLMPARSAVDQVTLHLDRESGFEGRVRIHARGTSVRASIIPASPEAARGLERGLGALERALAEHGFTHARVSVLAAPAGGEPASAATVRPEQRGESSDARDGRRPPPWVPRDPGSRRSKRDPHPQGT